MEEKLAPLIAEVEAAGRVTGRSLDARKEEEVAAFLQDADTAASLRAWVGPEKRGRDADP